MGNADGCLRLTSFQRQSLLVTIWETLNVLAIQEVVWRNLNLTKKTRVDT